MFFDINIKKFRYVDAPKDLLCLKYVNNNKYIAVGSVEGTVFLYNGKTLLLDYTLADKDTSSINNAATAITCDRKLNNVIACSYSGGLIKLWDVSNGNCIHTFQEMRQVCGVAFHPQKDKLFSYGDDGNIYVYDIESLRKEYTYKKSQRNILDGHVSKIFTLEFNPSAINEFLTGGWDRTLYYWDVRNQNAIRSISDIFMAGDGISVNKEGNQLVTCEWKAETPMKLWDYGTAKLIDTINPDAFTCHLYCGKYISNNWIAAGGSDVNLFRIINLRSNSTYSSVKDLGAGVYGLDLADFKKQALNKFDELNDLPIITFCSGKTICELKYR